jgi:hypothetical protein
MDLFGRIDASALLKGDSRELMARVVREQVGGKQAGG